MSAPDKRSVRRDLRARRREIAAGRDLAADGRRLADLATEAVRGRAVASPGPRLTVLSYESVPAEPPTDALNRALVAAGHRVLVPITLPDLDLDWHDVTDPARTPLGLEAVAEADVVLAPGLAVDSGGVRLGQGGGCYDKALPRRRQGTAVLVLLHPGELHDGPLPHEEHDVRVDGVLTADGRTDLPHPAADVRG